MKSSTCCCGRLPGGRCPPPLCRKALNLDAESSRLSCASTGRTAAPPLRPLLSLSVRPIVCRSATWLRMHGRRRDRRTEGKIGNARTLCPCPDEVPLELAVNPALSNEEATPTTIVRGSLGVFEAAKARRKLSKEHEHLRKAPYNTTVLSGHSRVQPLVSGSFQSTRKTVNLTGTCAREASGSNQLARACRRSLGDQGLIPTDRRLGGLTGTMLASLPYDEIKRTSGIICTVRSPGFVLKRTSS